MINMMGSDRIQKPSMLRMFRCDPTSFMRSISWRNCRFSSSPAFSKQKRELMNKRISVKISQEKQYLEGLWAAYPRKGSDMAYWLSSSLRQKRPQRNRKTPVLHGGTILHKINGKPRPPPPSPQMKDAKMARFCPSRGFILDFFRGGWGFAVPFYFVQDCSLLHSRV